MQRKTSHSSPLYAQKTPLNFWQTIRVTPDTMLREVLLMFHKECAREDFRGISTHGRDQLKYDLQQKSFSEFVKHLKKLRTRHSTRKPTSMSMLSHSASSMLPSRMASVLPAKKMRRWMKSETSSNGDTNTNN